MAKFEVGYEFVRNFDLWRVREIRDDGKYMVEQFYLDREPQYKSSAFFTEEQIESSTRTVDELREILATQTDCVRCGEHLSGIPAYMYENNERSHCGTTKDGRLLCQYCDKPINEGDLQKAVIISRNWKDNNYRSPERNYHKDGCASYDQMAHEG